MNKKIYLVTMGLVFSLVAILHFVRLVFAWEILIEGWVLPVWLSGIFVIAGFLAYEAFKISKELA